MSKLDDLRVFKSARLGEPRALVRDLATLGVLATSLPPGNIQQTADVSLDWLRRATGAEAAEVFVSGPQAKCLFQAAYRGPFRAAFSQIPHFHAGEGFPGLVLGAGQPLATNKLTGDRRFLRTRVKDKGFVSYVSVPLTSAQGAFGALSVASRRPDLDIERALRMMGWASRPIATAFQLALLEARECTVHGGFAGYQAQSLEDRIKALLKHLMALGHATGGMLLLFGARHKVVLQVAEGSITGRPCPSLAGAGLIRCPALARCEPVILSGHRPEWPHPCQTLDFVGATVQCIPLAADVSCQCVALLHYAGRAPAPVTAYLPLVMEGAASAARHIESWADFDYFRRGSVAQHVAQAAANRPVLSVDGLRGRTTEAPAEPSDRSDPLLDIRCLGPFEVYRQGRQVHSAMFPRRDAVTLLKALALQRGKPVTYEHLSEILQPEADPCQALDRLHVLAHTLRRTLEPTSQKPWSFLKSDCGRYYLDLNGPCRLDLQDFLELVELGRRLEAARDIIGALSAYDKAIGLYRGDLFEDDPYAEWCWEESQSLREQYLDLLGRAARLYQDNGFGVRAIELYQRALRTDPLREHMHLGLIHALWATGRPAEALRHYGHYRDLIRRELDAPPSPEIEALIHRIRHGHLV